VITMKRLVTLITAFCLVAGSVADAGVAIITGTGTGGSQGNTSTGVGSTITLTFSSAIPAGSLVVANISFRNSSTTAYTCVDTKLNTYQAGAGVTVNAYGVQMVYSVTANALTTSDTITCTVPGTANRGLIVAAFSGVAATPFDSASVTGSAAGVTTIGPVGPTGTLACNTTAGEVVVAGLGYGNAITGGAEDATFISLGTNDVSQGTHMAYKIVNANTAVTYSPTYTETASNWVAQLQGFKAASCTGAAIKRGLLLTGVGQ